ncbi:MAG: metallophosphoesterase [Candidatus Omnitrophota bacterium]
MKTFVVGDIHGAYRALIQCLARSGLNYQDDRLVVLGDICDGYPDVNLCIEELLKIKHCDFIIGNHDLWALDWALEGKEEDVWTSQGGLATIISYGNGPMPREHLYFLQRAHYWFALENNVFVHGGFDPDVPLSQQGKQKFVWDRELIQMALKKSQEDNNYKFTTYNEIFLGHTPTQNFKSNVPVHLCNVWALDTGAGGAGSLTIMDVNTKEYWQSDPTVQLYKGFRSR